MQHFDHADDYSADVRAKLGLSNQRSITGKSANWRWVEYDKIWRMTIRRLYLIPFLLLGLVSLACTLTREIPPTLAPSTPMSTITPEAGFQPPTLEPLEIKPPVGVIESQPQDVTAPSSIELVDANRMMADINTLVSFQSRHILSSPAPTTGIQAAQNFLIQELKAIAETSPNDYLQIDVYPHQFPLEWGGRQVFPANVVMAVQGTDAAAGVVMVTAHYDTALQQWFEGDLYQPGANDNASGVAAILEIARIMVQKPHRATLVFVLFAAEETGRQGSQAFVREFIQAQNIPLVAVINLDIIGSPTGRRGERYDNAMRAYSEGPNATSASRQLARLVDVAVQRVMPGMVISVEDRTDRSGRWGDHMSFSEQGYPAVRLIEMADDATIAHTTRDTIDRIDPAYLRRTTQVTLATLEILADGPNPPTLRPLQSSASDSSSMTLEWSHNPVCQSYVVALRRAESLVYNEFYTVEATSLSWGGFKNFESVTVACIDVDGRLGRFAPELLIPQPIQ